MSKRKEREKIGEGKVFGLELNKEEWLNFEPEESDILEITELIGVEGLPLARGTFWIEGKEFRDDHGLALRVACLTGGDDTTTPLLTQMFNRKKQQLHLCSSEGCRAEGFGAHATRVSHFLQANFTTRHLDPQVGRALQRRRRELSKRKGKGGVGGGEDSPGEAGPGRGAPMPARRGPSEHGRAPGGGEDWEEPAGAWEDYEEERIAQEEGGQLGEGRLPAAGPGSPEELRAALSKMRQRMGHGAGPKSRLAVKPGGGIFDAFSPAAEKSQGTLRPGKEDRPKEAEHPQADLREGVLRRSKKKEKSEEFKEKSKGVLKDLVTKASKMAPAQKEKKEKSKSSKTAIALVQTLAKGLGVKVKKPKEHLGHKRRVKFDDEPDEEGTTGEESGNSESGSSDTSDQEMSHEQADKATPPLERMSLKKAGSVLKMFVEHMSETLENLDEGAQAHGGSVTAGVSGIKYWHLVLKPLLGTRTRDAREVYCLLQALDHLRGGALDQLGDLLAARVMAIHQATADGGSWRAAKHMEIRPLEATSAARTNVILQARRFAKVADRASGVVERRSWWSGGKASSRWSDDGEAGKDSKGRGKGKKGKKGKKKEAGKDWKQLQEGPPDKTEAAG